MDLGNTRPLEPTNVACPSASHQARSAAGGNASIGRPQPSLGGAVAAEQPLQVLAVREVQPAAPRQQELAPERGHPVVHGDARAAAGEHLRRHQPGRTAADDGDVGCGSELA